MVYLRIRNNLFLVSFWKRASFHFAYRPSGPGKTKLFTLCLNLLVLLGAIGILVRIRGTLGDTQVRLYCFLGAAGILVRIRVTHRETQVR